jgi:hypothetical protein
MILDGIEAANDIAQGSDSSGLRPGPPATARLPVDRGSEHGLDGDAKCGGEPTEQRDRHVNAGLNALDRRDVDAHALGELRLAPVMLDPKLARSEPHFTT